MRFDAGYREEVVLRDGVRARLRLVRPEDRQRLLWGFDRLSPHSRFLRFFACKESLSDAELDYLTGVDQEHHFALGAVELDDRGQEREGLGIARFVRQELRPEAAEAAVTVADRVAGQGLGRLLVQRLVVAAAERGVERFRCEMLVENEAARALIRSLAVESDARYEGSGLVSVELPLPPSDRPLPDGNPLYRILKEAARRGR